MGNWTNKRAMRLEDLSAEVKLLLMLSRPDIQQENVSQIQALVTPNFDWKRFGKLGISSRLASLVYYIEKKWELNILPEEVRQAFKIYQFQVLSFNTILYRDYQQFQKICNEKEVGCIPIKGIYLAEKIYPENFLRQISDIDLVIKREETNSVMSILGDLGWKVKMITYKSKTHEKHFTFHTPFNALNASTPIDFHFELFDKNRGMDMPMSLLSKRLKNDTISGLNIQQLDSCDSFVYQCLHLYKHLLIEKGIKLATFVDLSYLIHQFDSTVTIEKILARSSEFGVKREVEIILTQVRDLWLNEHHPFFETYKQSPFDSRFNRTILSEFGEIQLSFIEKFKYSVVNRSKEYMHGWKTLPLIWYDLFPSKEYLKANYYQKTYLGNLIKRMTGVKV